MGPKWAPSGQTMWAPLGIYMGLHPGSKWVPLGIYMGPHLGPKWAIWAPLGIHLGSTWAPLGIHLGSTWAPLGPQMGYLGPKWATWAPLGIHLGSTWAPLGPHLGSKSAPSEQPTHVSFENFRYVLTTNSNRLESLLAICNLMVRMVIPRHFIITSLLIVSDCDMLMYGQFISISRLTV